MPKPIVLHNPFKPSAAPKRFEEIRDLRSVAVKDISVMNKQTELNFNYHEYPLPVAGDKVLVDVKYASLSSFDIAKLSKYILNLSTEFVGLGYDFAGVVVGAGSKYAASYPVGCTVLGVVNPLSKKGSLLSSLVANPSRDILIVVLDETLARLGALDIKLSFASVSPFLVGDTSPDSSSSEFLDSDLPIGTPKTRLTRKDPYEIENALPPMGKLCAFPAQYCRAQQSLTLMTGVFKSQGSANVLINGADTNLGYTILQTICSSVYTEILESYNVILVCQERNVKRLRNLAARLGSGGARNIQVIAFDLANEDLVLPGEKTPVNYKKVGFFAAEIIECMFKSIPESEKVGAANINKVKIDLFIDIVGSRKMFQQPVNVGSLDEVNFPFRDRFAPGVTLRKLLGSAKEPFFLKIMKPKSHGSTFVSYCKYTNPETSYLIDKLVDHTSKDMFNPWSMRWTLDLANQFVAKYSYYEKFELEIKRAWVEEAFRLVLAGELHVAVDDVVDWRSNYKKYIGQMRSHDGQTVFKIESF